MIKLGYCQPQVGWPLLTARDWGLRGGSGSTITCS